MNGAARPIAVSMGDPSGIGPDIIIKSWLETDIANLPDFYVVGTPSVLIERAEMLGHTLHVITQDNEPNDKALRVKDVGIACSGKPGQPDSESAKATVEAIDRAVEAACANMAAAVVTCPINKKVLYDVGFTHPGHTEYLAELADRNTGIPSTPVMMLAGPDLRTVPVTIHIPLHEVSRKLTCDMIVQTASILASGLSTRFGVAEPRIAVSGLNPHAGESGSLGHEDSERIEPAIKELRDMGINAFGPLPADTMFHPAARATYDAALCMYHDQALIPAKMLGFDDAVNVTLGLPFIRTSPDHGTAYDIAGSGKANPSSFIAALKMASEMASRS
ncbi:MAG: 4-hydroxythreonine-4-phosphate dehydrogenase PdxA [Pseudomonadota bacterium]